MPLRLPYRLSYLLARSRVDSRSRTPVRIRLPLRLALASALVPWLVACGNKNIDLVKAEMVPGGNYTYGQALDNNKSCADTTWKAYKDDKQRDMVSYHCEVVVPKAVLTPFLDKEAQALEEDRQTLRKNYDSYVAGTQKDLALRRDVCANDLSSAEVTRGDNLDTLAALRNGTYQRPEYSGGYTLESIQRKIDSDHKYVAKMFARCKAEIDGLERALAHMEKIKPDYMEAVDVYTKESLGQMETYYKQKRPINVNMVFPLQGQQLQRASFGMDVDGEVMTLIGNDIIAGFLGADDNKMPTAILNLLKSKSGDHIKAKFAFTCNRYYCDRDEALVNSQSLTKYEEPETPGS